MIWTKLWKKVKRTGFHASKCRINISLKEFIIHTERKPEKIRIALKKGHRKYTLKSRQLEKSFSFQNKYMVIWPDLGADTIDFNTTLFKNPSKEQFDNKEWTLIAEEVTKKGKTRPLAAVQLNFAFFVNQNPDVKTELKLKLRCLQKEVKNCTLSLILSSTLVQEGHAMDDDIQNQASVSSVKIPIDIPELPEENERITEGVKKITKDFEDWKEEDKKEISVKPTPPPVVKQAWGEQPRREEEERRRNSRNDEPPPPLPPHGLSTSRQSGLFLTDFISSKTLPPSPKKNESLFRWFNSTAPVFPTDSSRNHPPHDNSLNATPTRKIVTSFEKNVINVEDINEELKKIAERIKEIENLSQDIRERMQSVEQNSEDEQKYLIEHMKLMNEKHALFRKQDYLNVATEMRDVEEKLGIVQQQVNEVTTMNDADKTEEEKQRIDDLVEEYKSLIDKKNELAKILIQKEVEEEEHDKFGQDTLERSQNFLRGSQEPLNTSRRIINWIKSTTT